MARRKISALAASEYVSFEPEDSPEVWQARLRTIEATKRVFPQFLRSLDSDVLPIYTRLAKDGYRFRAFLWGQHPFERLSEDGGLKAGLLKWARGFNAEASWLLDQALRTLRDWHNFPDWRASQKWNTLNVYNIPPVIAPAFELSCEGWEVQLLSWSFYSASVRKRFEQKLSEYEMNARELANNAGLVRARLKHSPENFEWFVLYQFAGMSSTKIAERHSHQEKSVDDSTVLKGIKTAARLLHWTFLRSPATKSIRKIR